MPEGEGGIYNGRLRNQSKCSSHKLYFGLKNCRSFEVLLFCRGIASSTNACSMRLQANFHGRPQIQRDSIVRSITYTTVYIIVGGGVEPASSKQKRIS